MIERIKEICFLTMIGKIILSTQSGKQYEKICKVMLEFMTVIYLVGAVLGLIRADGVALKVFGEQIEIGEKKLSELETSIYEMQENACQKIKSKINNEEAGNAEKVQTEERVTEEKQDSRDGVKIDLTDEVQEKEVDEKTSFIEIEKVQINPVRMEGENGGDEQKQQNDYFSQ